MVMNIGKSLATDDCVKEHNWANDDVDDDYEYDNDGGKDASNNWQSPNFQPTLTPPVFVPPYLRFVPAF